MKISKLYKMYFPSAWEYKPVQYKYPQKFVEAGIEIDPAAWAEFCHLLRSENGHIYYVSAKMARPEDMASPDTSFKRLVYLATYEGKGTPKVMRDSSKCLDRKCLNPEHMLVLKETVPAPEPTPKPTKRDARIEREESRLLCLTRKVTYMDEDRATKAQADVRRKKRGKIGPKHIRRYKCPYCNLWHLTTHGN